jgi:hypothetical protein
MTVEGAQGAALRAARAHTGPRLAVLEACKDPARTITCTGKCAGPLLPAHAVYGFPRISS